MTIPVLNIYYLLCYAWNNLEEGKKTHVDVSDSTTLLDLFAKVLITGTSHLFKRGLDRQYLVFEEAISGVRGKMNISETIKGNYLQNSKIYCEFDELSYNILQNQILKATAFKLLNTPELDKDLKHSIKEIFNRLYTVDLVKINSSSFNKIRLNRNNCYYLFLLNVCKIIHECLLPDERTGKYIFSDFVRDERKMRNLFEKFIFNFYRIEQHEFNVHSEYLSWEWKTEDVEGMSLLPKMKTDISLEKGQTKIIIDTKYYHEALKSRFEADKLISANLYQIYTYIKHAKKTQNEYDNFCGVLLYPTVSYDLNKIYWNEENTSLCIKTLNLNQDWWLIRKDLLEIIGIKQTEYANQN